MHPLRLPELVLEIAAFVTAPRDLSSFAQVDRFSHTVVTPYLFHCIDIPLELIHSLAQSIRNHPLYAAGCRSLRLSFDPNLRQGVGPKPDADTLDRLYTDLITVFAAISIHGRLASFRWTSSIYQGQTVKISDSVCTALAAALGSVKDLAIGGHCAGTQICDAVTHTHLRALRLDLPGAHGLNCAHLQEMISSLSYLEELSLDFPLCCGPRGITLASTHPLLRRFSFTSCSLFPESDFLLRHPSIETLFLETDQYFSTGGILTDFASPGPSMLRFLNVDESSLWHSSSLFDSKITHLRLRDLYGDMESTAADALSALAPTIRCLELEVEGAREDPMPEYIVTLLRAAPGLALDELAIIRHGVNPGSDGWCTTLLTDLFATFGPAAPLRALRIQCAGPLLVAQLHDLGPLLPRLRYIGWDVVASGDAGSICSSAIHIVERHGDKNAVVQTISRPWTKDWTAQSILRYLGKAFPEESLS
ncbi:hypothetical protein DFH06DRAFT_1477180 [Mycena polygramma]|nr:hypothetical protein DFH06DRAFT_1477180 [Mycena polygramma]